MSFSEFSSRCDIATINSTSECVDNLLSNFMSQDGVTNIDEMIEARNQESEEACIRKKEEDLRTSKKVSNKNTGTLLKEKEILCMY